MASNSSFTDYSHVDNFTGYMKIVNSIVMKIAGGGAI